MFVESAIPTPPDIHDPILTQLDQRLCEIRAHIPSLRQHGLERVRNVDPRSNGRVAQTSVCRRRDEEVAHVVWYFGVGVDVFDAVGGRGHAVETVVGAAEVHYCGFSHVSCCLYSSALGSLVMILEAMRRKG